MASRKANRMPPAPPTSPRQLLHPFNIRVFTKVRVLTGFGGGAVCWGQHSPNGLQPIGTAAFKDENCALYLQSVQTPQDQKTTNTQNKWVETWKLFSNKQQFRTKLTLVHWAQALVGYLNLHLEKLENMGKLFLILLFIFCSKHCF